MLRNCASESNLVLLERRSSAQERYKIALEQQRERLRRSASGSRSSPSSKPAAQQSSTKALNQALPLALAVVCLAWALGVHFSPRNGEYERAMRTLDDICPPLTRVDNASVHLKEFEYDDFQGDWHKVAWLREPETNNMRCSFVTAQENARDLQHLEQISPTRDYKKKGYHFLLNRVSKLWVVDTDYANWAMLYTCSPHFGTTTQQAFIVSRKKTLDIVTMGDVLTKWSEYNIPWKEFRIKEQHNKCA